MWVKIGSPNIWVQRARKVVLDAGNKLTNSKIVHHENRNTLDDNLKNLKIVTRGQHVNLHREEFHKEALKFGVQNLIVERIGELT